MCENRNVNRNILIVDDEDKILKTLSKVLKDKFNKIITVSCPQQAIDILRKETVHIVITDYYMPDSTGLDLLKFINLNFDIPVIIMTGQANLKMAVETTNYHAYRFIEKPISLDSLNKLSEDLNDFLNKKEKEKNLILAGEATSTIIHEINNPLNIIHLRCETLKSTFQKDSEMVKKLETIEKSSNKISRIISQTRQLLVDKKYDKKYENFNLKQISQEIQEYVDSKNIEYTVDLTKLNQNFEISYDKEILLQVIYNLINNSNDAISDFKEKWIKIEAEVNQNNLFIKILDSGTGIPKDKIDSIFNKGFSGKNSTGIGLYLCRLLLENLNSKLYVDDKNNNTCFVIEIDLLEK